MPVPAPSDRRFLRARVKPGRRRSAWRTRLRAVRIVAVVGLLVAGGYQAALAVAGSGVLRITRVVVRGQTRMSTEDVLAAVEGLKGQSILSADLDVWRERVCALPWARDAAVRRSLPSTIEITVSERQPMAVARRGTWLFLIDEEGAVIDEYGPAYAEIDLPVVDGLTGWTAGGRPRLDGAGVQLAAKLFAAMRSRRDLAGRVSQVDVSDPHDAVVILDKDTVAVRLGEDQFVERLQAYLELEPLLRERAGDIEYVDLRFGERVYVAARRLRATDPAVAPITFRPQLPE